MADFIGSVDFREPGLRWIDRYDQVVMGDEVRTCTGDMVIFEVANPSQKYIYAKVAFDWLSIADVETLKKMARKGGTYSAKIDGRSCTIRFSRKDGVTAVKHQQWGDNVHHNKIKGKATDIYTGECNLIVVS